MLQKIENIFNHYFSKGTVITALIIAAHSLWAIMVFGTIDHLINLSGGLRTLDMIPMGYTPEYARELLDALGEEGRHYYLFRQIPLDMIYPGLFGISLTALLLWLFRKNQMTNLKFVCYIPLLAGFIDYAENAIIAHMLFYYPDFSNIFASCGSLLSILKSSCTTISYLLIIGFILKMVYRALKKQHSR